MSTALKTNQLRTLSREQQCAQLRTCRPSTAMLFNMCLMGIKPEYGSDPAKDFGIDTEDHFKALCWCFENGYLGPDDVDRGWRRGPILTELTQQYFDQPYMVTYKTTWDTQMEIEALSENMDIEWTNTELPTVEKGD